MRPTAIVLFALAAGCDKAAPPADPNAADKERLQGTWSVERVDAGSPKETDQMLKEVRDARLRFEGDALTWTDKDEVMRLSFTLDAGHDPKLLTVTTPETATAPARPRRWIYKFEGDVLVLALRSDGIDAPPPDFNPRPSPAPGEPGVAVAWLRKADEPKR